MSVIIPLPFHRTGPYTCACRVCGWSGSTNALARAAHLKGKQHAEAEARAMAKRKTVLAFAGEEIELKPC